MSQPSAVPDPDDQPDPAGEAVGDSSGAMVSNSVGDPVHKDDGAAADATMVAASGATPLPPRRLITVLVLAAIILVVDQITKVVAVAALTPGESPRILGGLVYFSLIRNPGAAWSLGTGMTWVLALVACVVVVVIVRMASRLRSGWWAASLGLILGGAVGNLMDRFFRAPGFLHGHVVDFVSVFGPDAEYFPVFNVADSGITIGAILLVLTSLRGIELDGSRARSARAERRDRARAADDTTGAPLLTHDATKKSDTMKSDGPDHG